MEEKYLEKLGEYLKLAYESKNLKSKSDELLIQVSATRNKAADGFKEIREQVVGMM